LTERAAENNGRRRLSRRRLLGALAIGATATLAACGEGRDGGPELTAFQESLLDSDNIARAAESRPAGLVLPDDPLAVMYVQSPWGAQGNDYRSFIGRAGTGGEGVVRLSAEPMPNAGDLTFGELLATFPESKPVDLVIFPVSRLEDLEANGRLTPLDKISDLSHLLDADAYWGDTLSAGQIRGRQMAIPLMLGPWLLMYNGTRLGEYGIKPPGPDPWGLDVFSDNVARLTYSAAGSGRPDAFGFVQMIPGESGGTPVPPSWVWMMSAGADLPGRDGGEHGLTSPQAIEALKLMSGLAYEQRTAYTVSGSNPWRQMRGILGDSKNGMMSFPANSGWFVTTWRKDGGRTGGFDLAALPGGRGHHTPTEIHMMVGLSSTTREPEAAIVGLGQIYDSIGDAMFPTAMKADVVRMKRASRSIRDDDVEALQLALGRSRTIIFTGAERNLLINQLDRPVFLERAKAEDAAEAARAAFEEVRFLAG
jgi:ABC-type glycerol-3-phosphate transport system substrate-binding protein